MTKTLGLGIALAAMLAAAPASAATLTNGSFEDTNATLGQVAPNTAQNALALGAWNVYTTMPGWYSTQQKGFELQRNTVVTAADGTNYIELESHPSPSSASNILQDFLVATTGIYTLSFEYRPRENVMNDNLINAIFGGVSTAVSGPPTPAFGTWTTIVIDALLFSGWNTLEFNAFGTIDNTRGGFIDNVAVNFKRLAPEVPLPAGLLLLLSGLGGLGFLGRSRSKVA